MMDTTTIYEPELPHECHPWPKPGDTTEGTIIRCDDCGRHWECRRERFSNGFGGHTAYWGRVRWWNFRARRRIDNQPQEDT